MNVGTIKFTSENRFGLIKIRHRGRGLISSMQQRGNLLRCLPHHLYDYFPRTWRRWMLVSRHSHALSRVHITVPKTRGLCLCVKLGSYSSYVLIASCGSFILLVTENMNREMKKIYRNV
jgi:hypothetical protein